MINAGSGYGNGSRIDLKFNDLTRFEATVWKSLLEKLAPFGGVPYAFIWNDYSKNKSIDTKSIRFI